MMRSSPRWRESPDRPRFPRSARRHQAPANPRRDVAAAVPCACMMPPHAARIFELGGPESSRYGKCPIPFVLAGPLAKLAEMLPQAPLSIAQVDLLRHDNLPSSGVGGVAESSRPGTSGTRSRNSRAHGNRRSGEGGARRITRQLAQTRMRPGHRGFASFHQGR